MDCGYKDPYHSLGCSPCCNGEKEEKKEPKILYPSFSLCGNVAKSLMRKHGVDEEVTITIKGKIVAQSDRSESAPYDQGCRVEIEVHDCAGEGINSRDAEDKDETATEAFAKYRENKGKTGSED